MRTAELEGLVPLVWANLVGGGNGAPGSAASVR
jgi:hypothetical protein